MRRHSTSERRRSNRSVKTLMRRLSRAGFKKDFVQRAILPDWWSAECDEDPRLVQDAEFHAARFLRCSLSDLAAARTLTSPQYPEAQLRRTGGTSRDRDRLRPAIHAAMRIAEAVVRNLQGVPAPRSLPESGLDWRREIVDGQTAPTLETIATQLWRRGIPVVPVDLLPARSFQGMACIVDDRPVILLGQKYDAPGRVAFFVAHEAGHIAAGDCTSGPVVDGEDETDLDDIELRADDYAGRVLVGQARADYSANIGYRDLAERAVGDERNYGADASFLIFSWARQTGDYKTATWALKALYRHEGARRQLPFSDLL